MANTLRFKRGLVSGIPTAALGEPLFTTDTFDLYIGNGTTNTRFQKYIASGTTSQLLRGDGSLLTMPIVLTSPANGQVLKYNGTSWVNDSDAGITGSGSATQIAYFTGATTLGSNNNFFWDNTNSRLNINTAGSTGSFTVNVRSSAAAILSLKGGASTNQGSALYITNANNSSTLAAFGDSATIAGGTPDLGAMIYTGASIPLQFYVNNSIRMTLDASGNLGLGVTPSASWVTGAKVMQIGVNSAIYNNNVNVSAFTHNAVLGNSTDTYIIASQASIYAQINGRHEWRYAPTGSIGGTITWSTPMTLTANGRLLLGTTTEGTQRLQVAGDVVITNSTLPSLKINHTAAGHASAWFDTNEFGLLVSSASTSASHYLTNMTSGGTSRFYVSANGSVGIGTTSLTGRGLAVSKTITGATSSYGILNDGVIQPDVTSIAAYNRVVMSKAAGAATSIVVGYWAVQGAYSGTVDTQYGYLVDSTLTGATNNYAFFSNIASGTGRWNLYMNGTAANYMNGNLLLGSTTDSGERLQVTGTMKVTGASTFNGNMTNAFASLAGGVTVIGGVTGISNGFRIDVDTSNQYQYSFRSGTNTTLLQIANTGAATFSSSVTAASLNINAGTQLSGFRGTLSSPNAGQIYYATDNSGWQLSIGKLVSTTYTAQMVFKDNATVTTTSDFILAGGYGLDFINGSGTTVTAMRSTAGGASILSTTSTGTHIVVGTEVAGDLILASNNTERIRLSSSGFFSQLNATNPSSSITDSYIQYSADVVAGNAAPHFRTENGAVIKLYQETTAVGNSIISLGGGNSILDDTTFDGYTLRQIVKALRNQGILQ